MTRILELDGREPLHILPAEVGDKGVWICRCGLTRNGPFCDGSHKATRDEPGNVVFRYTRGEAGDLKRAPVDGQDAAADAAAAAGASAEAGTA